MRGAWLWPTYVVATIAGGVLLRELPFYTGAPADLWGATLIAGFANLAAVALAAPLAARLLRRRRPDLPRAIARDYAGTALVGALFVLAAVGGIAHRPALRAEADDRVAQLVAVRGYVTAQAREFVPGLAAADSLRIAQDLYRTCVPGPDPKRPLCLIVSTDQDPPGIARDLDRAPNSEYRRHGGF